VILVVFQVFMRVRLLEQEVRRPRGSESPNSNASGSLAQRILEEHFY
jgi:hypothetical protein